MLLGVIIDFRLRCQDAGGLRPSYLGPPESIGV